MPRVVPGGTIECVDGEGGLPEDFLNDADLVVVPGLVPAREARAWLCDWHGERGVLRARPVPADAVVRSRLLDDVAWLHAFLARLAGQGFPAPRPLPAFSGKSWTAAGDKLWDLVSFIPGREVGWDSEPPLDQIGALLGRYHAAARRITTTGQRPGVIPLAEVPAILLSDKLAAAGPSPQRAAVIRRLAERLVADLEDIAGSSAAPIVIHGDFTAHNVIACGIPPRLAGVIDFQRAHVEVPVADIGYGLWRSGRPRQNAASLDLARLWRFIHGYASAVSLPPQDARALPVYLYGRGLQMIAKRVQAGLAETWPLAQVQWTAAHATAIADTAEAALP
jgi:Ser/Thr protein kinase RdoA (MazF antagonist)